MIIELRYTAIRATETYSGIYPPIIMRTVSAAAATYIHAVKIAKRYT